MNLKIFLVLLIVLLSADKHRQLDDYKASLESVTQYIEEDYEALTESFNHPIQLDDYKASLESVTLEKLDNVEASTESLNHPLQLDDYKASLESVTQKLVDYALYVHSFVRNRFWKLADHAPFFSSLVWDHFWKLPDYALVVSSSIRGLFWPENRDLFYLHILPFILASALCVILVYQLTATVPWYSRQFFYLVVIAATPTVHFSEACYRRVWNPAASELTRTLVEALKELYFAIAVYFFLLLLELQLKTVHGDNYLDAIRTKTFQLYKIKTFRGTKNNILSMRRWTYGPIFVILSMFALRAYFEQGKSIPDFYKHVFQCALLLVSEAGTLAVHIFAEGIKSNLAWNIKVFEYFLLFMWLQGPGFVLYSAYRSFFVVVTSLWFGGQFCWVFKGFKLHAE